jgi:prepilin-type processing-associated H-X9-DG protein
MYTQDYDEKFPLYYFSNPTGIGDQGWHWALKPYVKNTQLFVCPSATAINTSCDPTVVDDNTRSGSYGYNGAYLGTYSSWSPLTAQTTSMAAIQSAAETIVISEITTTIDLGYAYPPEVWSYPRASRCDGSAQTIEAQFSTRHFEGNNFVFADGHAKWLKKSAVRDSNKDGVDDDGLWDLN